MTLPKLPCLLIFHCPGFPTYSASIQLPSHAIHHLTINYIVTFTVDLYTEFSLQLENSRLQLSVFLQRHKKQYISFERLLISYTIPCFPLILFHSSPNTFNPWISSHKSKIPCFNTPTYNKEDLYKS